MKEKYLICFDENQNVAAIGNDWKLLLDTPAHPIFAGDKAIFRDASVVLVETSHHYRLRILAAAKLIIATAAEVKILQVNEASKITKDLLDETPPVPKALLEMDVEDIENLADINKVKYLHTAQDYHNGIIYYGAVINEQNYIVTSERMLFPFAEAIQRDMKLVPEENLESNLRQDIVYQYFANGAVLTPDGVFLQTQEYIKKYIYFQNPELYNLIPLWVMGTYIYRAFRYYPYLHIHSEKGSGKTLLMELMSQIAFNGRLFSQPVVSTIVKLIHQFSATLFIDEAESLHQVGGSNAQLKQILRTGFAKSGDYYVGDTLYNTFSPKCFAGINDLDDVLADRTIVVKMIRKMPGEYVEIFRETPDTRKVQMMIRDELYLFGLQHGPAIAKDYEAKKPNYDKLVHLSNRAYDVWVPLYRIASAFTEQDLKNEIFNSLDKLSQLDGKRRVIRDAEENTTASLINNLEGAFKIVQPLDEKNGIRYYDPDALYDQMARLERIPKALSRKGFSGLLRRTLDIVSLPHAHGLGTKRMYAVDTKKFEEYTKRYTEAVQE